jgi:hypothetical protein
MERGISYYFVDLLKHAKEPNGFTKPWVVIGYFEDTENGMLQKKLFHALRKQGWKRTFFQMIHQGQTAGLVKTVQGEPGHQYHVHFYGSGKIEFEKELHRFRSMHFTHPAAIGREILQEIIKIIEACIEFSRIEMNKILELALTA